MDILTLSDLIHELVTTNVEILNQQNIKHPTTIGSMYEGLTADILNKTVFQGLNLKVIKNSFIQGCDTEFDVLLVEGDGEQVPYTDRYTYKPEQVIAIIQVKKNLYSKDIKEGYNNLKFLIDYFEYKEPEKFVKRLFRDSFRYTCKKDITAMRADELTKNEELIFQTLKADASLPVRILLGYNGFATEYSFRDSLYKFLLDNITTDFDNKKSGFCPQNFPNMIICGQYTMLKNNAMPFIQPLLENGWWPFYASSSYNPAYYFLELIWTRLSYKFEISSEIFGEDLDLQPATRFMDCRMQECNGNLCWEYNKIPASDEILRGNTVVTEWQPVELDRIQHLVISRLCKEELDLQKDKCFENFVTKNSHLSLADFVKNLEATNLVFVENNKLKLLTDQCQCVIMPNGKFFAGENKSGRVTNWMKKEIKKRNKKL
jgi:hypothetical protein